MDSEEYCNFALPFLQRMFPNFSKDWIVDKNLWRARWAQPVVEKNYSKLIPPKEGPKQGFYICSMAQIYPEDRGTNYAVKEAKDLVRRFF